MSADAAPDDAAHKEIVRQAYASTAMNAASCCVTPALARMKIGYTPEEQHFVGSSDLGVGCGAPTSFADLSPGESVLDLGCGAGVDVFLAARKVRGTNGRRGRVVGVDVTSEMLDRARARAREMALDGVDVEFRLGELESLPVESSSMDVVVSNCVINLCSDKKAALREAFRALRPGGRLCVADVVSRGKELPPALKTNEALAC
jgi:arsenite methyltransferase